MDERQALIDRLTKLHKQLLANGSLRFYVTDDSGSTIFSEAVTALSAVQRQDKKVESLRHHVRALQMLLKGQHSPMDFKAFAAEVDAIDRVLDE